MQKEYCERIRRNLVYLVDKMELGDIETEIQARLILTKRMLEHVQSEKLSYKKNQLFFDMLEKRPDEKFFDFVRILRENDQEHIANLLDPDQLWVTPPRTVHPSQQQQVRRPVQASDTSLDFHMDVREGPSSAANNMGDTKPRDQHHIADRLDPDQLYIPQADQPTPDQPNPAPRPSYSRDTEDVLYQLDTLDMDVTELKDDPNVYPMLTKPLGKCLIVNNVDFTSMPSREGSNVDANNLKILFTKLCFEVEVKRNVEEKAFNTLLDKFADDPAHCENSCMVLIILTHGKKDYVYSADEHKIPVCTVIDRFNGQGCPRLIGKPKIIMIQACRGPKRDRGVRLQLDGGVLGWRCLRWRCFGKRTQLLIPTHADMLVAYCTVYGYVAIRDTDDGSWFMQSVVEIFKNNAHKEHVADMLAMVNEKVAEKAEKLENGVREKSMPQSVTTLRKKLYFIPKK